VNFYVSQDLDVITGWDGPFIQIGDVMYAQITAETVSWLRKHTTAPREKQLQFATALKRNGLIFEPSEPFWPENVPNFNFPSNQQVELEENARRSREEWFGPKKWSNIQEWIEEYSRLPFASKSVCKQQAKDLIERGFFDYLGKRDDLLIPFQSKSRARVLPAKEREQAGGVYGGDT